MLKAYGYCTRMPNEDSEDRIYKLNTISFKRGGRRIEGTVIALRRGTYMVKHPRTGVIFLVKARDATKECP